MSTGRQFLLPDLGEGLTEAELVIWHVAVGDEVKLNQALAEVETEKAVVELPSPFAGTVVELLAQPGETVRVGAPLITIDSSATEPTETEAESETGAWAETDTRTDHAEGQVPMLVGYGPSAAPPSRRRRSGSRHREQARPMPPALPVPPVPPPPTAPARPLAPPPVRFMARQNGVDLMDVTGHGPGGVITREDLATHLARVSARDSPDRETRVPGTRRPEAHGGGHDPQRGHRATSVRLSHCGRDAHRRAHRTAAPEPALRGPPRDATRRRRPGRRPRPARTSRV